MPSTSLDMPALQTLRAQFAQALKDFAESSSSFRILHSAPSSSLPASSSPASVRALYVLDSSFNPPSKAHSSLVRTALTSPGRLSPTREQNPEPEEQDAGSRVLFLLATVNADKKPKPADFEDRLVMMALMAEDLRASFSSSSNASHNHNDSDSPRGPAVAPTIDIGITKHPYFIDKARAIDESNSYISSDLSKTPVVEQIHLTGFDTLLRIFTPKYYPSHTPPLSALAPFLTRHRLRATIRVDAATPSANLQDAQQSATAGKNADGGDDYATEAGQRAYLARIARGEMERDGLKREWADRVELVVDSSGEADGVSSTKVRDAAKEEQWDEVVELVGHNVAAYVREMALYRPDGEGEK